MANKDTFCSKIFYHEEINPWAKTVPCCLIRPTDADIDKMRTQLLNGERPIECKTCWDLEDKSIESDRQIKNKSLDFYLDRDIERIEEDCKNGNYSTKTVKIAISNLCNATCVNCNSGLSSAWATLRKEKTFTIVDQTKIDSIDWGGLVMLSFVGGEPLIDKKVFATLEKMIELGNTDCFIDMVTNGSVELTTKQIETLNKFNNVQMVLSIDGIEKRFEYMRYPLKWNKLLDNIDLFKELGFSLAISYTVSNVNAMYYNETIDWFNKQGIPHNTNPVTEPLYFSPQCLPVEVKKKIDVPFINSENHITAHDEQFIKACQQLREQDKLKEIDIADYLPEFNEVMENG